MCAERRFHRKRVPVRGANHFSDRPVNAAQRASLRLLHDDLRRLTEAFQFLFQLGKKMNARIAGAQLYRELCLPFGSFRRFLLAPCHEHGMAGDHIGETLFFFLYFVQALLLFGQTRRGFLILPFGGGEIFLCLRRAFFHRVEVFRQKRYGGTALRQRAGKFVFA